MSRTDGSGRETVPPSFVLQVDALASGPDPLVCRGHPEQHCPRYRRRYVHRFPHRRWCVVPAEYVSDHDALGVRGRPPMGRNVNNGRRKPGGEQNVLRQVRVHELRTPQRLQCVGGAAEPEYGTELPTA